MNKEDWIERLEFQSKTYSGIWLTDKDCKELKKILEEKTP